MDRAVTAVMVEQIAFTIAHVAFTTIAASVLGAWALGSRFAFAHATLRWAVQTAVGFLVISSAVFVLALSGLTSSTHLTVLSAILALIALGWLGSHAWRARQRATAVDVRKALGRLRIWHWIGSGAVALYGLWIILCAALPPTSVDELNHHLAVPARMLESGGAVRFLDNIYAYFPAHGEMLFLLGLGVGGELAARLFHVASGFVLALALFGFSRRYLPTAAASWSVAFFLSIPSVMVILPWAYVDVMFTLFAFLALATLVEYFESRRWRWVILTGVMAGGALATKYTGLQLMMLLMLLLLGEHLASRRERLPAAPLVSAGVAAVIVAPYVWRNWQLTGWPLFPFAFGPFALRPEMNWDLDRAALFLVMLDNYGSGTPLAPSTLWDALAAPVLVFINARFNDPRWYDGIVGPVFLLTPLALWRRDTSARFGMLAAFAVMFLLYWGLTVRQVRFLIPILPVLCFLLAVGLHEWRSRAAYIFAGIYVMVSAAFGVSNVLAADPMAFWRGSESRDAYLQRRIAVYSIYQAANHRLGPHDRLYLIHMRNLGYYLQRDWRADFVFESYQLQQHLQSSANPQDLTTFFDSREITHVLIDEQITYSDFALPGNERATLQAFLNERATVVERIDGRTLYRLHTGG